VRLHPERRVAWQMRDYTQQCSERAFEDHFIVRRVPKEYDNATLDRLLILAFWRDE
jgi:hypothetical protein